MPHIRFTAPDAVGRLVVNQLLRGEWTPAAAHLFAKNLHCLHGRDANPGLFETRAIVIARLPAPTIRSIRRHCAALGRNECQTDRVAAKNHVERGGGLVEHWERFGEGRRVGLTFDALITGPDAALGVISSRLEIDPPLENRYVSRAASRRRSAGDPIASGGFTRIKARKANPGAELDAALDRPADLRRATGEAYARYIEAVVPRS
jgi:hypothetical protein